MGNCLVKVKTSPPNDYVSTRTSHDVSASSAPADEKPSSSFPLDELPPDLKERIAKFAGPRTTRALREVNRSFRLATASIPKKLVISSIEPGHLRTTLAALPAMSDITVNLTITDTSDDCSTNLAALAQLHPAIRAKIRRLNLRDFRTYKRHAGGLSDANIAVLQSLPQLQTLCLHSCNYLSDAGLAPLQSLTQLQSLDLTGCSNLTDVGLAHLQSLTQL
ncbi:MAG: hypothetical protein V4695_00740 [Pseudomonadota bacterium]